MAACSFSPVAYVGTCGDAFYFQEAAAETGLDEDSFCISTRSLCRWVGSHDNKFLLLNSEQHFQVQNLTCNQLNQNDCKFKVQIFHESDEAGREGMAVMLYVKNDEGKNVVACCGPNHKIYSETMDPLPKDIAETHHRALFYMTRLAPTNMFQFESSEFPSEFLEFVPDGENPSLKKLVLRKKGQNEVVDSCHVLLRCSQ